MKQNEQADYAFCNSLFYSSVMTVEFLTRDASMFYNYLYFKRENTFFLLTVFLMIHVLKSLT